MDDTRVKQRFLKELHSKEFLSALDQCWSNHGKAVQEKFSGDEIVLDGEMRRLAMPGGPISKFVQASLADKLYPPSSVAVSSLAAEVASQFFYNTPTQSIVSRLEAFVLKDWREHISMPIPAFLTGSEIASGESDRDRRHRGDMQWLSHRTSAPIWETESAKLYFDGIMPPDRVRPGLSDWPSQNVVIRFCHLGSTPEVCGVVERSLPVWILMLFARDPYGLTLRSFNLTIDEFEEGRPNLQAVLNLYFAPITNRSISRRVKNAMDVVVLALEQESAVFGTAACFAAIDILLADDRKDASPTSPSLGAQVAKRAACLLEPDQSKRHLAEAVIKKLYKHRNAVLHGNLLNGKSMVDVSTVLIGSLLVAMAGWAGTQKRMNESDYPLVRKLFDNLDSSAPTGGLPDGTLETPAVQIWRLGWPLEDWD